MIVLEKTQSRAYNYIFFLFAFIFLLKFSGFMNSWKQFKIMAKILAWEKKAVQLSLDFWLHKSLSLFLPFLLLALSPDSKACGQV